MDEEKEAREVEEEPTLNVVRIEDHSEFAKKKKELPPNLDVDARRQVSKALLDQINELPRILKRVALGYLQESNYPALRQYCKNNELDYNEVASAITSYRTRRNSPGDFMAILLDIEKEIDKQRGPLARALLFEMGVNEKNLAALDLFLKHMHKEKRDDKRAILTSIELPDPD